MSYLWPKERNVTPPHRPDRDACYDLNLVKDGDNEHGVLEVTLRCGFKFEDAELAGGAAMVWTDETKETFRHDYIKACEYDWSYNYYIEGRSNWAALRQIGVNIIIEPDAWFDHWTLKIKSIRGTEHDGSKTGHDGKVTLDSSDMVPREKSTGLLQRGAIHEFGHMLGLKDEYSSAGDPASHWVSIEHDSVMDVGEAVKPRHYVPFAMWISKKLDGEYYVVGQGKHWTESDASLL